MLQIPGCHIWCGVKVEEPNELYSELLPSPEKVATILTGVYQNKEEEKMFSSSEDTYVLYPSKTVYHFLRWATLRETLAVPNITVQFHRANMQKEPYFVKKMWHLPKV